MPFHFSLAAALKFRENMEQREYVALEKIQYEISETEALLLEVQQLREAAMQRTESELAQGIPALQLQDDRQQEAAIEQKRQALLARLRELKSQKLQRLKAYQLARQKREVLDELRGRQRGMYDREQAKRQQTLLDELFLVRRQRDE